MEVCIPDNRKYEKAIGILYDMGGFFWTRPTHVLVLISRKLRPSRSRITTSFSTSILGPLMPPTDFSKS